MHIRFSYDSLLDWSEPNEGVQIFSEHITDEVSVVGVLPHPESSPEVASPAYYYFKSISTGNELPESEVVHLQGIAGHTMEVSYEGVPLPHASTIFPEE